MAIATISGDTGSVHNLLEDADLARTGRSDTSRTGLALVTGKPLRPAPQGAAGQGDPLASAPFYRAMPTAIAFAPRPEAIAPAVRGYALSVSARSSPSSAAQASGATSKTATRARSTVSFLRADDSSRTAASTLETPKSYSSETVFSNFVGDPASVRATGNMERRTRVGWLIHGWVTPVGP